MSNRDLVYKIISSIPKGKVLTYGQVAKLTGIKSPRAIGNILHNNTDTEKIPCHRVINSKGKVAKNYAFGGAKGQVDKLVREGVQIEKDRVDLNKYLCKPI